MGNTNYEENLESSYKASGVDIKAGEETVDKIKELVKGTFNKNVLAGIGHFGAFYEFDTEKYKKPVLVSSVDGVGTKLKVAIMMDKHKTVGQDLVNHCINDIAVCGADPLYFMDYMAFGKLFTEKAADIIEGFAIACKENNIALIGGETAEMPGLYAENDYDLSGTIVGVVEKERIINGSLVKSGDVLIGFASTGLHTNGYSLARNALFSKYNVNDKHDRLEGTLGEELLKIHKSYLPLINELKTKHSIHAFSHITGGGIIGNTNRVVPAGNKIEMNWNSWEILPIFEIIQETGDISDDEMRKVFNLGIGLIAIVDKNDVNAVLESCKSINEEGWVIGEIK